MKDYAMRLRALTITAGLFAILPFQSVAQQHHGHGHQHDADKPVVERPKIFLDKSPRIVAYQLQRLDNERLLLVERKPTDPKYAPVYSAILTRAGMSPQYRDEAVAALATLHDTTAAGELLGALENLSTEDDPQQLQTGQQLVRMMLRQPQSELAKAEPLLQEAIQSDRPFLRAAGYAALSVAGESVKSRQLGLANAKSTLDWLASIALIPQPQVRAAQRPSIVQLLDDKNPVEVRAAAAVAIGATPNERADTFTRLSKLATDRALRAPAIRTLLKIAPKERNMDASQALLDSLVDYAEATPAAQRTTDAFIDAMQLADQLLAKSSPQRAKELRARLREITVRVVRIQTVEEEMRYDTPYFAVEAGRPVQVVLKNDDLMPHNLVITVPDALQEVAQLGLEIGPEGHDGKAYVPNSDKVLFATKLVPSHSQVRLTFTAPASPGEYPFVCTFPRHWMRMYGVMVVTEDLDAWNRNPTVPKDPVGSKRAFVQNWKVDDLKPSLDEGLRGRTFSIGERLFKEATCAQCHKVQGQGGAVGPELTDVFKRWKGNRDAVLREVLEPSYRIDDKYAVHLIRTDEGEVISGIIVAETKDEISILDNPEAKKPRVIPVDEIERKVKTSTSMMPKALLDRFTQDEIFEILAYLEALNK